MFIINVLSTQIGKLIEERAYEKCQDNTEEEMENKKMKCNKCKYYDKDDKECYFFSMGSGNPIDMPCYTKEQTGYWKELKINENMLMCSECGVMFNKNLIYDYTEKNPLVFKFCPCCGSYMGE